MRKPPTRLKKTIGWLLSAFLLVVYFSPQAQLLRTLPARLSVAVGQQAVLDAPFPLTVEAGEDVSAGASLDETLEEGAGTSTATISFLGLLPLREVEIDISDDLRLYPGGQAVGVALHTQGVLVVGLSDITTQEGPVSPARACGLQAGDVITHINDDPVNSIEQVQTVLQDLEGDEMELTVLRDESSRDMTTHAVQCSADGAYKLGAWIRDSMAGIGTLTFYEPETGRFGTLGHGISDVDTAVLMKLQRGAITPASIAGVVKGVDGRPGELRGSFSSGKDLGTLYANTTCGVFGEPAGVTGAAALKKACEEGLIPHDATVVSVVTGNGLKDVANAIKSAGSPVHIEPDLNLMVEEFKKRGVVVE